jgi:hypothetical protein
MQNYSFACCFTWVCTFICSSDRRMNSLGRTCCYGQDRERKLVLSKTWAWVEDNIKASNQNTTRIWIGLIWLMIISSGCLLWTSSCIFGFHLKAGNSLIRRATISFSRSTLFLARCELNLLRADSVCPSVHVLTREPLDGFWWNLVLVIPLEATPSPQTLKL